MVTLGLLIILVTVTTVAKDYQPEPVENQTTELILWGMARISRNFKSVTVYMII